MLWGFGLIFTAGLLFYSQTRAFAWDEGFHLLAAQLIGAGKKPYLDFCFPQTPLNAYWNAAWMRALGETWRVPHAIAALLTAGAVMLTADYVFTHLPLPSWRFPAAIAVISVVGLNLTVFEFGPIGQAYGLCLFLIVAAYRVSIASVGRAHPAMPFLAGFLSNAAAASSLLTAPVAPVLLIWILFYNRIGKRWARLAAFAAGSAIPWLPVLWLFWQSPSQVIFGVIDYNRLYRQVHWDDAIRHDLEVMAAWLDSSQALLLGLLAIAGVLFIAFRSGWDRRVRAEFYLCGWLSIGIAALICNAHPNFPRYYLLTVPFLGILAGVGLYAICSRMLDRDRPFWPVLILTLLTFGDLVKALYERSGDYAWHDVEAIGAKVDQVTPRGVPLLADENVYFVTRRPPPSGMELADSHRLTFSPAFEAAMHLVTRAELERQVSAGVFATVESCEDDEKNEALGLTKIYAHKAEIAGCAVFWDKRASGATVKSGK